MDGDLKHSTYDDFSPLWEFSEDNYAGEMHMKAQGDKYIFPTDGHFRDGYPTATSRGAGNYRAYLGRAVYPDIYEVGIVSAVGIMHRKSANIKLPAKMEHMRDNATSSGESLLDVLRKINSNQLINGRLGLLGDLKIGKATEGRLTLYAAPSVVNWSTTTTDGMAADGFTYALLDESSATMGPDFVWRKMKPRYRVITLSDTKTDLKPSMDGKFYITGTITKASEIPTAEYVTPGVQGKAFEGLPFRTINTLDIAPEAEKPPLLGLAGLCVTIYRGECDYRLNLFLQGQDTLVRIGAKGKGEDGTRVGHGAIIDVPINGDAKFIGTESKGLTEQREALTNDYRRAGERIGKLNDSGGQVESGESRKVRQSSQTVTLPQIAKAGAAGLQGVLRDLAVWLGADPEEVIVEPNMDFTDEGVQGDVLMDIVSAKGIGAPLSMKSIHDWMRDHNVTQVDYETELALIKQEKGTILGADNDDRTD